MGGRNLREKGERTEKIEGENLGERGRELKKLRERIWEKRGRETGRKGGVNLGEKRV